MKYIAKESDSIVEAQKIKGFEINLKTGEHLVNLEDGQQKRRPLVHGAIYKPGDFYVEALPMHTSDTVRSFIEPGFVVIVDKVIFNRLYKPFQLSGCGK